MKLCVIGNSHAGMLVHASRAKPSEHMNLTFFARQGKGPEGARIRGTELRAIRRDLRKNLTKMGMPEAVNLPDYDGIVLVAMTATMFSLGPMLSSHSVFSWASTQGAIDAAGGKLERPLVSEAALNSALRAEIEDNLAHTMIGRVRKVTDAPIILVPQPHPSEHVLDATDRFGMFRQIVRRGDGEDAARLLNGAHEKTFGSFAGVYPLVQPEETIAHGCLTRTEFTRGAGRLNVDGRQNETDILHANARYGAIVLDQVARQMQSI